MATTTTTFPASWTKTISTPASLKIQDAYHYALLLAGDLASDESSFSKAEHAATFAEAKTLAQRTVDLCEGAGLLLPLLARVPFIRARSWKALEKASAWIVKLICAWSAEQAIDPNCGTVLVEDVERATRELLEHSDEPFRKAWRMLSESYGAPATLAAISGRAATARAYSREWSGRPVELKRIGVETVEEKTSREAGERVDALLVSPLSTKAIDEALEVLRSVGGSGLSWKTTVRIADLCALRADVAHYEALRVELREPRDLFAPETAGEKALREAKERQALALDPAEVPFVDADRVDAFEPPAELETPPWTAPEEPKAWTLADQLTSRCLAPVVAGETTTVEQDGLRVEARKVGDRTFDVVLASATARIELGAKSFERTVSLFSAAFAQ